MVKAFILSDAQGAKISGAGTPSKYIRYKLKSDPRYVKDYCKRWKKSCHISGEHDEKETVTKFNPPL